MSERRRRLLPRSRRAWAGVAAAVVIVIAGIALAGWLYKRDRTGSIYHPQAPFTQQTTPALPAVGPDRTAWPLYGYNKNHTRYFPAPASVRPPFAQAWVHNAHALLEFPPVIWGNHIVQLADNGTLYALNRHNGVTFWHRSVGILAASTPAIDARTIYVTVLESGVPGVSGRVLAVNYRDGRTRWYRNLPSPSESSPMLDRGRLYFGTQSGLVYCLDARTGHVVWTYQAGGSVKASPTLAGGVLYFGDYSGHLQAVSEQTGKALWVSGSEGALFGSGTFYSTASVIYGRVYLGNTDGRVYAYDASNGKLDWAVQTGAYVYSSPAVTDAPGLGPTVYVGSYDGTFYALNARSGQVSWKFTTGGRISGSPTIIGRIVYFADLGERRVYGLGISTGHVLFSRKPGSFDPVISDGSRIYMTGYSGLYALSPY